MIAENVPLAHGTGASAPAGHQNPRGQGYPIAAAVVVVLLLLGEPQGTPTIEALQGVVGPLAVQEPLTALKLPVLELELKGALLLLYAHEYDDELQGNQPPLLLLLLLLVPTSLAGASGAGSALPLTQT